MRITSLPVIVAGGLALQATASPIRIVVVASHQEVPAVRFGHAVGEAAPNPVAHIVRPDVLTTAPQAAGPGAGRRPHHFCASMREKGLQIANKFRNILGLPLIASVPAPQAEKAHTEPKVPTDNLVHFLPFPTATPEGPKKDTQTDHRLSEGHFHRRPHHHHERPHGLFIQRVHHALMALGPWEGRAVAFVLGCGIGVLLRMIWVMTVLTFRMFRPSNNAAAETDYYYGAPEAVEYVVFDGDAETIVVPPPQYTEEKVAAAQADVKIAEPKDANDSAN